jgi:hypothetical protein
MRMSGNLFELHEKVNGDYRVEELTTQIILGDKKLLDNNILRWSKDEAGYETLSIDEILEQVTNMCVSTDVKIPLIRINYESGMWGVIFEIGNYSSADKQWIVHGITKGYA